MLQWAFPGHTQISIHNQSSLWVGQRDAWWLAHSRNDPGASFLLPAPCPQRPCSALETHGSCRTRDATSKTWFQFWFNVTIFFSKLSICLVIIPLCVLCVTSPALCTTVCPPCRSSAQGNAGLQSSVFHTMRHQVLVRKCNQIQMCILGCFFFFFVS